MEFCSLFYLQFLIQVISEKTLCSKGFTGNLRGIFYMKAILTINPTHQVANFFLSSFFSFLANQKQKSGFQRVGGLVTRNISVFVQSESYSTSKPCRIQKTFIKELSYMLLLFLLQFHSYYSSIPTAERSGLQQQQDCVYSENITR